MNDTQTGETTLAIELCRLVGLDATKLRSLIITAKGGVVSVHATTVEGEPLDFALPSHGPALNSPAVVRVDLSEFNLAPASHTVPEALA